MSFHPLLLNLARRHPRLILLNVLLGFSGALFNGVSTALIIPVLLSFLGQPVATQGAPPIIQSLLTPFLNAGGDYTLWLMALAILVLILLKNLASYCNTVVAGLLKRSTANDLRDQGLRLLLEVDMDYYVKTGMGDVINRLNGEVSRAASAVSTITRTLTVGITVLVFVGLLLSMSWELTVVSTALLTIVALANQSSISRSRTFGKLLSEASRNYSSAVLDLISGMRLVRSTANEQLEYQKITQQIHNREQAEFKAQVISALIDPVNEVAGILALLCIVMIGRLFLAQQVESFSTILLTYLFVLFRTLPLIAQLNSARSQLANLSPSLEIAQDFLRRDNKSFMPNGDLLFQALEQGIQFKQLSFAYPGQTKQVLKSIDLYLPRNRTLALVGASGAGKSTLADLLPRFYDPTGGAILLDGQDLCAFDVRSLRRAMGIVSQDTFLFNASVRENIAYGCSDATDDQIIDAAKRANAYDFILQLPDGFETQIGDRGVMLSGGQRQRLAIARALVQNPAILILDEATSALDTVSERLVQEAIEQLSRDRTTLVIAHRLSTVKNADQIAVMDQGKVVELGTHDELVAKNGYYRRLCEMQFSETAAKPVARPAAAKVSYELRSLLNSLLGSLSLILNGIIDDPQEQQEFTQEAYSAALKLTQSLEQLEQEHMQPDEFAFQHQRHSLIPELSME